MHLLEGVVEHVNGDPFVALAGAAATDPVEPAAARVAPSAQTERYRFCTEALVRGDALPEQAAVQERLRNHGDSLLVIRTGDLLKVHIHTDDPEAVFAWLRRQGRLVAHKAEDMTCQHRALERSAAAHVDLARRPVAILTDSACDLPAEVIAAHGITVVPLTLIIDGEAYRDGIDVSAGDFARRLVAGARGSTSQPPPAAFVEAYTRAAVEGERIVGVIVASALSGTFHSARAAAQRFDAAPVNLVDSRAATLLQGFLTLKAAELAERGAEPPAIAAELARVRARSGLFFTVDVFDHLLASGRVGRGRVLLANLLDIKPILELDADGKVEPVARVRGRDNVFPRLLEILERRVPTTARALRFGVVHVAADDVAERVAAELRRRYGDRDIIVAPAGPVLATHVGPGAWGVAYLLED
ncbi:MAG: DegV family EDD domain-containing protein [Gemmatimonadetes bacterium]|nr:DegV family EDD domain-containing protein [Gemmatimonadota bacterium]